MFTGRLHTVAQCPPHPRGVTLRAQTALITAQLCRHLSSRLLCRGRGHARCTSPHPSPASSGAQSLRTRSPAQLTRATADRPDPTVPAPPRPSPPPTQTERSRPRSKRLCLLFLASGDTVGQQQGGGMARRPLQPGATPRPLGLSRVTGTRPVSTAIKREGAQQIITSLRDISDIISDIVYEGFLCMT